MRRCASARARGLPPVWFLGVVLAGVSACVVDGTDPSDEAVDAGGSSPGSDAASPADARTAADSGGDLTVDAEPLCALPMTITLDDSGQASFLYDHPECDGAPGSDLAATLVFRDTIDDDNLFSSAPPDEQWQVQEIEYPELDCLVVTADNALFCEGVHAGDLIPIRIASGATQLDIEFVLDHEGQTITVEGLERSQ